VIVIDSRSVSVNSGCEEKMFGEAHVSVGLLSLAAVGEYDCSRLPISVRANPAASIEVAGTKFVPRIPVKDGGCPSGWVAEVSGWGGIVVSVMTEVSVPGVIIC
jgi:hypothetical protein